MEFPLPYGATAKWFESRLIRSKFGSLRLSTRPAERGPIIRGTSSLIWGKDSGAGLQSCNLGGGEKNWKKEEDSQYCGQQISEVSSQKGSRNFETENLLSMERWAKKRGQETVCADD